MNKNRRKQLGKIAARLEEIESQITALCDEEQEAFDNLPESLQYTDKGAQMSEAIDEMESIITELSDLKDRLYAYKASPVKSQQQPISILSIG